MSGITKPAFKPLLMVESCLLSTPSVFIVKFSHQRVSVPPRPIKFHLSHCHSLSALSLKSKIHFSSVIPSVSRTSDWTQQEQENNPSFTITESEQEESAWENEESDDAEARESEWEAEGEDAPIEAIGGDEESGEDGSLEEAGPDEEFAEPPEDAKLFVGNLPYDIDGQKLAMLFENAGIVEIAEIIYDRGTDLSRGFGFVTMSTVEEAQKAVEMFHRYDLNGRVLTVNKASARGELRPERTPRVSEPSYKAFVTNLPWDVDDARLEQVFSEYGKVLNTRVVCDRETGRSRGFGFVTLSSETELNDAIAGLDGQTLDGRALRVTVAEERRRGFV